MLPGCGSSGIAIFQNGSYCGINVVFDRVAPADAFLAAGATFQSDPAHGASHVITISFDPPVPSVTVTAYDPTFDGNSMSAYDNTNTLIGTIPFPGNHTPGTLTTQTGTLSGSISTLLLTPAPLDYVAYSAIIGSAPAAPTLQVVCAPAVPVRGTVVDCAIRMSDSSTFTLTRLHSSVGGATIRRHHRERRRTGGV